MSYKDKLKQAQQTGIDRPKIELSYFFRMKEDEKGRVAFNYYDKDKDKEKDVFIVKPLMGMHIGTAMTMEAYSDDLGSKGGTYRSTYYFNKSHKMGVLAPTKGGFGIVHQGTAEEIESFMQQKSGGAVHKRAVLFILTQKGDLIGVQTNLAIAIDQLKKVKDKTLDYMITLTPSLYGKDANVTANCDKILGKFAAKNPPKYADISVGDAIDEAWVDSIDGETFIDMFTEYKKYVLADNIDEPVKVEEPAPTTTGTADDLYQVFTKKEEIIDEDENDELPF